MQHGRRFSSEIICPCCLKHVVTKPKQPSLILNHHEPSRETFFQSPAAEANKNCHHAQSKCRKPRKKDSRTNIATIYIRSIVSSLTKISFVTVQILLAPLAFKNSATLAPGWAKLKCSQSIQSVATPSRPTRSGATEIVRHAGTTA